MRATFYVFIMVALSTIFVSCATTDIAGYRNPDFKGSKMKKIMIYALFDDLNVRKTIEEAVEDSFQQEGYNAIPSLRYFSPAKQYTSEEIANVLTEYKIDGVLILSLTDASTSTSYVPESKTYKTDGNANVIGDYLYYKSKTTVQTNGGYYVSKPIVDFESVLFSTDKGIKAWFAQSRTKGNAYAKWGTLASSLGSNIIESLMEENLVLPDKNMK